MGLPPGVTRQPSEKQVAGLQAAAKLAPFQIPGVVEGGLDGGADKRSDSPQRPAVSGAAAHSGKAAAAFDLSQFSGVVPGFQLPDFEFFEQDEDELAEEEEEREKEFVLYGDGLAARLAKNRSFENMTLAVISFNAIWIGVDTELNDADIWTEAHPVFQVADNFFCVYFSFEVMVRLFAFRNPLFFWKDKSFVFDSILVFLMVFETWALVIITMVGSSEGGQAGFMSQISVLRLLRLLRLTRMARLMRSLPELMTLMKGLVAAVRSVGTTFLFQMGIMWVFGIIFTQQYKKEKPEAGEAYQELKEFYFSRLGISMITLFIQGTLLDELTSVALLLREDSTIMLIVFFLFVLLSSLTLLNMLIGILTTVVSDTADREKDSMAIDEARTALRKVFRVADENQNGLISHDEFLLMLSDQDSALLQTLLSLGIQEDRLHELGHQLFSDEDHNECQTVAEAVVQASTLKTIKQEEQVTVGGKDLSFNYFMDELLKLLPGDAVSIRDITMLRRASGAVGKHVKHCVVELDRQLKAMSQASSSPRGLVSMDLPEEHALAQAMCGAGIANKASKLSPVPTQIIMDEIKLRLSNKQGQVGKLASQTGDGD